MNLTSLDLATRLCGWAAGDGAMIPECGAWPLPQVGEDLGRMLDLYDLALNHHIETHRPDAIGYEAPILVTRRFDPRTGTMRGRTDDPLTIRKIYSLGGHTEFVCRRRGIECSEIELHDVKAELTGNRMADKDAMVAVARKMGLTLPDEGFKDAADAFGGWLYMLRHYDKAASRRWDAAIWSGRGALL